jgi:hypothetical protein
MKKLENNSIEKIERAYGNEEVTFDEAIAALEKKDSKIRKDPRNKNHDGTFYLYNRSARRKLEAISWVVSRILVVKKKRKKQEKR